MSPSDAAEMLRKAARGLDGAAVQVGSGRPVSVRLGWQRAAQAVTAVADALPVSSPEPTVPSLALAPIGTVAAIPARGNAPVDYVVRVPCISEADLKRGEWFSARRNYMTFAELAALRGEIHGVPQPVNHG